VISTKLVIKAILPLAAVVLLLAGIVLLRAESPSAGAVFIALAMIGLIVGLRLITNSPFTSEELEALRPFMMQAILWIAVVTLCLIAVLNVADN